GAIILDLDQHTAALLGDDQVLTPDRLDVVDLRTTVEAAAYLRHRRTVVAFFGDQRQDALDGHVLVDRRHGAETEQEEKCSKRADDQDADQAEAALLVLHSTHSPFS